MFLEAPFEMNPRFKKAVGPGALFTRLIFGIL